MESFFSDLTSGWPDAEQFGRITLRLLAAALVGAVSGIQREQAGKPAGLRTHMLVSLGAAVFVLVPVELGAPVGEVGRVVQGVATGIGFIGAGAILKREKSGEVEGLTTAAGIWLTAAAGAAIGFGGIAIALVAMVLAWIILAVLGRIEARLRSNRPTL
jgi:putative Mg2+ transporter-C (MgtC) family protein